MGVKILKICGILTLLIILSSFVIAEPSYNVIITLDNNNLKKGEISDFHVYIEGGGPCEASKLNIVSELILNISKDSISVGTDSPHPTVISVDDKYKHMKLSCETDSGEIIEYSVSEGQTRRNIFIDTEGYFESITYGHYEVKGGFNTSLINEGGDYDITATFSCKSNGTWYTFHDEAAVHIKYFLEDRQYIISVIAVIISLLAFYYSFKNKNQKRNNREQKNVLMKKIMKNLKKLKIKSKIERDVEHAVTDAEKRLKKIKEKTK